MTPQEQKQIEREQRDIKQTAEKIATRSRLFAKIAFIISLVGIIALLGIFSAGIYQIFSWIAA